MSTMITEVYNAFKSAGVDDEKAAAAAQAIEEARESERLSGIEKNMTKIEIKLTMIHGEMTLIKWMLGLNIAFSIAVFWMVFKFLIK